MKQVSLYDKKSAPKVSTKYRILFFCDSNQNYIASVFIGRTDAEAEALILWPPVGKNWLIRKDPYAGKDWRQEEKGTTEDGITDSMAMSLSWWWTGKPGVLQSMESRRIRHDWATELKVFTSCRFLFFRDSNQDYSWEKVEKNSQLATWWCSGSS